MFKATSPRSSRDHGKDLKFPLFFLNCPQKLLLYFHSVFVLSDVPKDKCKRPKNVNVVELGRLPMFVAREEDPRKKDWKN